MYKVIYKSGNGLLMKRKPVTVTLLNSFCSWIKVALYRKHLVSVKQMWVPSKRVLGVWFKILLARKCNPHVRKLSHIIHLHIQPCLYHLKFWQTRLAEWLAKQTYMISFTNVYQWRQLFNLLLPWDINNFLPILILNDHRIYKV